MAAPGAVGTDKRRVIRVYVDNNLLGPNAAEYRAETEALQWLEVERRAGRLEWMVSRRTANELEKAPIEREEALEAAYGAVTHLGDDHTVKHFSSVDLGAAGFVTMPMVEDVPDERIFVELSGMGLDVMDARHLTVVIHNGCDVFLTMDKKVLRCRAEIAARYRTIDVMKPSDLWTRLRDMEGRDGTTR